MIEIQSVKQLEAVVIGGVKYICEQFEQERIVCHPIGQVTFLPSRPEFVPQGFRKGIALGWMLLYSLDGQSWTYNFKAILKEALESDGHFYISDWKLNVIMSVEHYMIDEVTDLLTTIFDDLTLIEKFRWKETRLGEIASFHISEYFAR
ncbi:hypothetical protein B5V88_05430 [Heyndrickxia sporothermodurans]|uniref:Uncharacterized protein n=1 Tax=Heyndrickxia sporothermodurans TaxID=46224 RepID=A0AB37HGS7_9BACI|nr:MULTISPECIES: hypothetical protein [Bacillaceae]MBG9541487.1 hypothetical protein [Cytobacillus firmus]MBG9546240.1 hypothetical protein [Cytobacillus firmus]MBG9552134.1 hypothetical protein [Cytobacillus firmus]MBG9559284.1 hypothetical protein [Cytobacillus firmus]MBG9577478.1 hypothetical protein [Cytobacillus firmus]